MRERAPRSPCSWRRVREASWDGTWVNDIHSRLNRTHVRRVVRPGSVEELQDAVRGARREGAPVKASQGAGTRWVDSSLAPKQFCSTPPVSTL